MCLKSDLSRKNVVKIDNSDHFRPYLLVNLDRAYIYLCGKEIIAESRDFVLTGKKSIIAEYKEFWKTEHHPQKVFRNYRIVHDQIKAEKDRNYFCNSSEVSEVDFLKKVFK